MRSIEITGELTGGLQTAPMRFFPSIPAAKAVPARSWDSLLIRMIDVVGSSILLALLAPFYPIVALLIKLDSKGPAVYKQKRVGLNGEFFSMYKLRTMVDNAHAQLLSIVGEENACSPVLKPRVDCRVTRVGRFLRRASIDELPQLINVLKGEMSLVGPRPIIEEEAVHYTHTQRERFHGKPGITGLAQIMGRTDLPFHRINKWDRFYTKNCNVALYLWVLVMTVPFAVRGKGVY